MRNDRLLAFACSLFSAASLNLAQPAPVPAEPAQPAAVASPAAEVKEIASDETIRDKAPQERRREVRIERKGPGRRVVIERSEESGDVVRVFPDDGSGEGKKKERRVVRNKSDRREDVIIHGFSGPAKLHLKGLPAGPEDDPAEHLEQAAHHLHAAGMHELAERVHARAERLRTQPKPKGDKNLGEQLDNLKRQHEQLKGELDKLKQSMQASKTRDRDNDN